MSNEDVIMTDPASCMAQGRRSYLLSDFNSAVTFFGQACMLLSEKHGEVANELADPYLNYGRALLNLNREEQGVLGPNVPGTEDAEEEEVEEDGNEEKEETKTDDKAETNDDKVEASEDKVETSEDKVETSDEKMETIDEKVETSEEKVETSDDKPTNGEKSKEEPEETDAKPETSTDATDAKENGEASHSEQNGEGNDSEDEDDDENKSNLQLAWEVLELSKVIYSKLPDSESKLAEIHRLLGEVAMESNNLDDAVNDLEKSLELYRGLTPKDSRCIADVLYQLGLASSLQNDFEKAIERFTESTDLIKGSIHDLQQDPPIIFDSSINVEQELKELKELLPEIEAKIADMREMDQNTAKAVLENVKKYMSGETTNGAGPSGAGSSGSSSASTSTAKEVKDISHLVRKSKRKNEDETSELASPCKKPVITPSEKSV
ncbi:protein HGV2 isoform X1 [Trichogramma pretiosum]|uniref:protein HGV2 isoform X1 n=2 Tax=Trichogramma pretiosum TaxID=7493 RepID=UPI0006C9D03E|nr:protein HGV2 isoform X1 [Trichogramma pretiosum]